MRIEVARVDESALVRGRSGKVPLVLSRVRCGIARADGLSVAF